MQITFRHIFYIIFFVGMALCTNGIGRIAKNNDWLNPFAIIGYLIGVIAIILFVLVVTNTKIFAITNDKIAVIVLIGIILLKYVVSFLYQIFKS